MNPDDESKRRINIDNKALNARVACMHGGMDFLEELGFQVCFGPFCLSAAMYPSHVLLSHMHQLLTCLICTAATDYRLCIAQCNERRERNKMLRWQLVL
jgi:hypothetical protein